MKTKLLNTLSRIIKEEVENEETVEISAEDYMKLLKRVNYAAQAIPKLPQFRGKQIVVNGNVNLRGNKKITDLGPIKIEGQLDVAQTNIKSLDNTKVTRHISYWQTPYEKVVYRRRQARKMEEQKQKRRDGDWDMDNDNLDEEGVRANLVFQYAVDEGHIQELDDDEKERVQEIKKEIKRLEDDDEVDLIDIQDQIDDLEDELSELLEDKFDVYYFYHSGTFYEMDEFELLEDGSRYAIGTDDEAEDSMREYYEEWVDYPESYISSDYLSHYLDADYVVDEARYSVEEWVRDSPEDYGVERTELSQSQEEEKERLENQISELQEKLYDLEDEDEVDEIEDEIDQLETQIEEITDYPEGDYSEEEIEDAIENYLEDNVRHDPAEWLKDMGMDVSDYIDREELLDALVSDNDYGDTLNSYDGTYELITYDNDYYIIMRVDV